MIINFPTALYDSVLPSITEPGNITYTISNKNPPVSAAVLQQLPRNEQIRKQPKRTYTKAQKRKFAGDLVFNLAIPSLSTAGDGSTTFEIGQFLDFTTEVQEQPDPYALESIDIRQDTGVVNYQKYGLNQDEYDNIVKLAADMMDKITSDINITATKLNDNADSMSSTQASINDAVKLYNNIVLVAGADSEQAKKVQSKIDFYNAMKDSLSIERTDLLAILDSLRNNLSNVREVVR